MNWTDDGAYIAENARQANKWLLGKYVPNELYENCSKVRLAGTCDWILEQPEFVDWASSHFQGATPKWLWINGPPGFGKTILCSRMTEHLSASLDTPVAHFFFSSDFDGCEDPFMAIRWWISQVTSHPTAAALLQHSHASEFGRPTATTRLVVELLGHIVRAVSHCTFVLDGLDECTYWRREPGLQPGNSAADLLTAIDNAVKGTETRIMVCSRDVPELRQCLTNARASEYRLTPGDVGSDTAAYAQSLVDQMLPNKEPGLRREISERMSTRCGGQFLWLKLQGKDLRGGKSRRRLLETIDRAPAGLERIYDKQWSKIETYQEEDRSRVMSLLRWAAFALRPLTVCEITEAVLIQLDRPGLCVDDLPDSIDQEYLQTEIVGLCASLLEIRDTAPQGSPIGRRTVHLIHFSVREYLVNRMQQHEDVLAKKRLLNTSFEARQAAELAKVCLWYLQDPAVWRQAGSNHGAVPIGAFCNYAAGYWYQHASAAGTLDGELTEAINQLFDPNSTLWALWRQWYDFYHGESLGPCLDDDADVKVSPVYYASHMGLEKIVELLVRTQNRSPDGQCPSGQTALAAAAYNGHFEVARFLLDNGADVEARDIRGRTALFAACRGGSEQVLQLLLERGASALVTADDGWTPLMTACSHGRTDLVKILLDKGADAAAADDCGCTPIMIALQKEHVDNRVVEMILDQGVDMTVPGADDLTPLSYAVLSGNTEAVGMMVDRGADMNTMTPEATRLSFMPCVWGTGDTRCFASRSEQTGFMHGVDRAVDDITTTMNESHPDQAAHSSNLASIFGRQFERTASLEDLNQAIDFATTAIDASHPNRAILMKNLGFWLGKRFERTGSLDDLDRAINTTTMAMDDTPQGHPERVHILSDLGSFLFEQFIRSGNLDLLDRAIDLTIEAADACPQDHPDRAGFMGDYGRLLSTRFELKGSRDDLNRAIDLATEAANTCPQDRLDRASLLGDLGRLLGRRFELEGSRNDLNRAINAINEAINAANASLSSNHPVQAGFLGSFGRLLGRRFELEGSRRDLDCAIIATREAANAFPQDHPDRASLLGYLGSLLERSGQAPWKTTTLAG